MSSISELPKLLPKCLPTIQTIFLKDDSIQRLGGEIADQNKMGKNQ